MQSGIGGGAPHIVQAQVKPHIYQPKVAATCNCAVICALRPSRLKNREKTKARRVLVREDPHHRLIKINSMVLQDHMSGVLQSLLRQLCGFLPQKATKACCHKLLPQSEGSHSSVKCCCNIGEEAAQGPGVQPWTIDDATRFLDAIGSYGKGNWKQIADEFFAERTSKQLSAKWTSMKHMARAAEARPDRCRSRESQTVKHESLVC